MPRFSAGQYGLVPGPVQVVPPRDAWRRPPVRAPPGQRPCSGGYMAANEEADNQDQPDQSVHAFREPPVACRRGVRGLETEYG